MFAWNGLLAFWLVAVFFGVWFLVMTWQLLATIGVQPTEGQREPAVTGTSA